MALLAFVYIKCQTIKVTLGFVNRTDELSYGLFEFDENDEKEKNLIDVQFQKKIFHEEQINKSLKFCFTLREHSE